MHLNMRQQFRGISLSQQDFFEAMVHHGGYHFYEDFRVVEKRREYFLDTVLGRAGTIATPKASNKKCKKQT